MSHSVYSFSGSHRWMPCPASIRMSKGYFDTTNEPAEIGTATHQAGEFCISLGIPTDWVIGLTFNNHVIDKRMADGAALYKNVVNDLSLKYGVPALLEQRVVMSSLGRDDVYGTSDCTHIVPHQRILHTTDYKNGMVTVDVNDNSQTAGYSVATLDTFQLWDKVDTIVNTIIQPNYDHIDGPVRHVVYSIQDMLEWREKYRIAVNRADDPNEKPVAGPHCHYCPAQSNCRARMQYYLQMAYTDCHPDHISLGELELMYSEKRSVMKFLENLEGRMLAEAREGAQFKDYKLVNSYSRATCEDEKGLIEEAKKLGVDPLSLYLDPRLVGKTRALEVLPKDVVTRYYRVPPVTTTVVSKDDRRPAVRVGKAEGVFKPIEQPLQSAAGVFSPIK